MEVKTAEDKTFTGAFIAAPNVPWGASVERGTGTGTSARTATTRCGPGRYEMATTLLAAGTAPTRRRPSTTSSATRPSRTARSAEHLAELHHRARLGAAG